MVTLACRLYQKRRNFMALYLMKIQFDKNIPEYITMARHCIGKKVSPAFK